MPAVTPPTSVFRTFVLDRRGMARPIANRRGERWMDRDVQRSPVPAALCREREGVVLCLVEGFTTTPGGLDTVHQWHVVTASRVWDQAPSPIWTEGRWICDALARGIATLRGEAPTPDLGALAGFLAHARVDRAAALPAVAQSVGVPLQSLLSVGQRRARPYAAQTIYWNLGAGGARQGCDHNPAHPFRGAVRLTSPDAGALLGPAVPSRYFFEQGGTLTQAEELAILSQYSDAATGAGDLVLLPGWNAAASARHAARDDVKGGRTASPRTRRRS